MRKFSCRRDAADGWGKARLAGRRRGGSREGRGAQARGVQHGLRALLCLGWAPALPLKGGGGSEPLEGSKGRLLLLSFTRCHFWPLNSKPWHPLAPVMLRGLSRSGHMEKYTQTRGISTMNMNSVLPFSISALSDRDTSFLIPAGQRRGSGTARQSSDKCWECPFIKSVTAPVQSFHGDQGRKKKKKKMWWVQIGEIN